MSSLIRNNEPRLVGFLPFEGAAWQPESEMRATDPIFALCWADGRVWDRVAGWRDDGADVVRFVTPCPPISPYIKDRAA